MSDPNVPGYGHRKRHIFSKIRSLLILLTNEPSEYDEIASEIEYWIEYVICEGFVMVDELVEGVSGIAWDSGGSFASVARFFKEFRDAPHRSGQARTFVAQLCTHVLRWFAIASVEDLSWSWKQYSISPSDGSGFVRAASFVGHLIEWGLLAHDLVRQHLIKSLTNHRYHSGDENSPEAVRANAIYQLFAAAGNALLQGLLDSEDAQVCFKILDTRRGWIKAFESAKLQEFRDIRSAWMQRGEEEGKKDIREAEEHQGELWGTVTAEFLAEANTPVAFAPQNLPAATINIGIPPSISQNAESSFVSDDMGSLPEPFTSVATGATSSPTLSISTISDLTPTELSEDIKHGEEQVAVHHDTFYFEDGNVEILCRDTIFRVHSPILSFSSPKLRDILSQPALLRAPTPGGCPRVTVSNSAEDFAILLKMIYTPGFPPRHEALEFTLFASLLRMTTKYSFSSVRDQLVKDIEGAYPTRWENFQGAKILGEDVFGSPEPHPNAVLTLFVAENVGCAIPFAAYRASIGGSSALMSDKPGTVLPPHTLASTIRGMHVLQTSASDVARIAAYGGYLRVCPDKACVLSAEINLVEERMVAMEKIYSAVIGQREGGLLSSPSLGHLLCSNCAKPVYTVHAACGSGIWEQLAPAFNISRGWDDL